MQEATFLIQGSADEPYIVRFIRKSPTNLSAYCSCPAGQNGQYCKHRTTILAGDDCNVVSNNIADIARVQEWSKGTDIQSALNEIHEFEHQLFELKELLKKSKKKLAIAMRD